MIARAKVNTPKRQQGLAVLVLVIIIILVFITYAFSDLSIVRVRIDQDENAVDVIRYFDSIHEDIPKNAQRRQKGKISFLKREH